jgi:uracil-DNA glycosylase
VPTALEDLATVASTCTRCPLAAGRTQVVFGTGDPDADLVFIGEGPGAEEDRQGLPFVGRSGQLLDKLMLEELGITRERVYIANVVKCRPPDNRDPRPEEITACRPYLEQQLDLIKPKVLVTLGKFAGQLLLDSTVGITKLRGHDYPYRDATLIPTLHPAYALRGGGEPLAQMRADFVRAKRALVAAGSSTLERGRRND